MVLIEQLLQQAARQPDTVAVETPERQLSYAELAQQVEAFAAWLDGYRPRVLALLADNGWSWLVADLAALRLGVPLVPVPPFFSAAQQRHVLADAGVDLLLAPDKAPPVGAVVGARHGLSLQRLVLADQSRPNLPLGVAKITYTSGTTGAPKGVCLSQAHLHHTLSALQQATTDLIEQRHLCTLPLAVLLENIAGAYLALTLGITLVLPPLAQLGMGATCPDPEALLRAINHSQPDSLILLPQTLALLVSAAEQGRLAARPAFVAVGGGKSARSLLQRADGLGLPVYEGYGLSECASVVALNTPVARRLGSVGKPLSHVKVKLAADGEVLIGGNTMLGYLGGEPPTGLLASGDLGHLDADGYLHISGRKKHTIVTGMGRNVAPEWLEAECAGIPGLDQLLVYGDEQRGIRALAITSSPDTVRREIARINQSLPGYARIEQLSFSNRPFSFDSGELTANGRLRREQILRLRALA